MQQKRQKRFRCFGSEFKTRTHSCVFPLQTPLLAPDPTYSRQHCSVTKSSQYGFTDDGAKMQTFVTMATVLNSVSDRSLRLADHSGRAF